MTITEGFLEIKDAHGAYLAIGDAVVVWRPFGLDIAAIEKYNPKTKMIHLRIDNVVNNMPAKPTRYHTPYYSGKFLRLN